jgi:HlyD family secretion protein
MKKLLKSKIFWIIITIVIIIAAFGIRAAKKGKKIEYITEEVKRGSVVQTVSATGQIKSASEIELNFKNAGKMAVLNVKIGDEVEKDQVLAQLKATDLAISVNRAGADLNEAIANLDKLKAGATTEDVAVSEAAVEQARIDLENTEATYSQALENERQSILVDANTALTKANISLQEVYDTLHYEGDRDNFRTSKPSLENETDEEYRVSIDQVDEAELAYNLAKLDPTDSNIDEAVDATLDALLQAEETLDDLSELLDNVILTSVLTLAELNTLKTDVNTERTTTDTSVSTVQTAKQDLADARLDYQTEVDEAEKTLAKKEADLALKEAPARVEDIALYEAKVSKARADLQLAQDKYNDTLIKAPIAGVITEINFDVGEQTSLSEPAIVMLAAENYEIEVDIPESDIVKIDVVDDAEITLDAFTSEDIFKGIVTTINPAQTEIQDVVYYRVTVTFTDDQPQNVFSLMARIKPGMTANVVAKTAQVDNVLIIPLRAVKTEDSKKIVEILENEMPRTVEVTTGLKGDEGTVEVKSGLSEGQKVITFTREEK